MTRFKTIAIVISIVTLFTLAPVASFGTDNQIVVRQQDNGIVIQDAAEIVIGGMFDLSGQTASLCRSYVQGIEAAIKQTNDSGGISGAPVKLVALDYAGDPDRIITVYKNLLKKYKVSAIQGWGAMDTTLLSPLIAQDHIVYMSTWCRSEFVDPEKSPYHFFISATFEDHARMAMKYAADNGMQKVCFIYPDLPFGKEPAEAGKSYAKQLGLTLGPDVVVGLRATQAMENLEKLQAFDPEVAWVGGTSPSTAVILRDAVRLDLHTMFLINSWGFSGGLARMIGEEEQNRVLGFSVVRPSYTAQETGPGRGMDRDLSHQLLFDQGWTAMMVLREGLARARRLGVLDGRKLKAAMESLRDFETNGLAPPLTFTADDHRGTVNCGLYALKDGAAELHSNMVLER
jgi:branched-chain amino acid transport system substrate-binding protein